VLTLVSSTASRKNDKFAPAKRVRSENNMAWLRRQFAELDSPSQRLTHLVLLGGRGLTAFRLRVAQSHVRHDLLPSNWSHAVLVGELAPKVEDTTIYELSLEPPGGFQKVPETNGLQTSTLGHYSSRREFPNIAVLRLPVPVADWRNKHPAKGRVAPLDHYTRQRAILDAPALVVPWLSFVWGVADAGNPLLNGVGIPSAVMIETILNSVGYDPSPGVDSRAACPEAFYQSAAWWQMYYQDGQMEPITGSYTVEHQIEP
jgi:hypothetical protein